MAVDPGNPAAASERTLKTLWCGNGATVFGTPARQVWNHGRWSLMRAS
jgi:hypothetical protein